MIVDLHQTSDCSSELSDLGLLFLLDSKVPVFRVITFRYKRHPSVSLMALFIVYKVWHRCDRTFNGWSKQPSTELRSDVCL